jgi:tRNASer (uridine44-2'-O)-methyltransferase
MPVSSLKTADGPWQTAPEYQSPCDFSQEQFLQVTNLLLENPNLNSTHLFRADVLYDSAHQLRTVHEKERDCQLEDKHGSRPEQQVNLAEAPCVDNAILQRRVLRRLIPRKPQLDRTLEQWCYIYDLAENPDITGNVVIYVPHVQSEADIPWYHPPVKSLAYLHEHGNRLSVHFLTFLHHDKTQPRLHRTMLSLLQTCLRLAKTPKQDGAQLTPSSLKDTIVPQSVVQDTYSRLKQKYAQDLISRWVEKTEPAKHVFEDISIAAFLIELWKQMYPRDGTFPGFIDIACGNGVLTYLLTKEGYHGRGFDARKRITWKALDMEDYLDEMVCIPQPFLDHAPSELSVDYLHKTGMKIHNGLFNGGFNGLLSGLFKPGTFVVSNHADELTPWTPILAALSSPESPLPFLAIPCCSHALSGAKHRYSPKDIASSTTAINGTEAQSATGDLKALRAAKLKAANHQDDKSMYACLTRKVIALAEEVDCDVELTLMRIPSTRNIGVVGNRRKTFAEVTTASGTAREQPHSRAESAARDLPIKDKVMELLVRECTMSGGLIEASRTWIERAQKLQKGQGRGKVNLGGKPSATSDHG